MLWEMSKDQTSKQYEWVATIKPGVGGGNINASNFHDKINPALVLTIVINNCIELFEVYQSQLNNKTICW